MNKFWLVVAVMWAFVIFRLTTTPQLVVSQDSVLQMLIMAGGHFFFFGIQAVLLWYAGIYNLYVPVGLTSLYGLAIELVQRGIPGRSADPVDWMLDTLGAIVFLYFMRKLKYL